MLVALAPAVTFAPKVYLMASNLRNKKELIEELEGGGETSPEEQQAKQKAIMLEFAKAEAEVKQMLAGIAKTEAETHKTLIEADMAQLPMDQVNVPQIIPPLQDMQSPPPMPPQGPPDGMAPPQFVDDSVPPPGFPGEEELQQPPPGIIGRETGQL